MDMGIVIMIKSAYETLLLKGRKMDKIESQVRQAIIQGEIRSINELNVSTF